MKISNTIVMMLLRIILLVLVITVVLLYTQRRKPDIERFGDGEPTMGDLIASALSTLPKEEMEFALSAQDDLPFDLDKPVNQVIQGVDENGAPIGSNVFGNSVNSFLKEMDPTSAPKTFTSRQVRYQRPTVRQRKAPARKPSSGPFAPAGTPETTNDALVDENYAELVMSLERNAFEKCYQSECAPIEEEIATACDPFKVECAIQSQLNIADCLNIHYDRCDTSELRKCKEYCRSTWGELGSRTSLTEADSMTSYDKLISPSGRSMLVLHANGNLVLYHDKVITWSSNSDNSMTGGGEANGPFTLALYKNGDLILKNKNNIDIWHTNTWMDALGGGLMNGPYKFEVANNEIYIMNGKAQKLWSNVNSS